VQTSQQCKVIKDSVHRAIWSNR